jgi:hypothetical protein
LSDTTLDVSCSNLATDDVLTVAGLYRLMTGTGPDLAELNAYGADETPSALAQTLWAQADCQDIWGSLNNADFVSDLADLVLDTPLDAAGLAYWAGRLGDDLSRPELFLMANSLDSWHHAAFADGLAIG